MDTRLRYISISHQTAPVSRRERFHLSDAEKEKVTKALQAAFPDLSSLLLLVTCNRTEIYFESVQTRACMVRDHLLQFIVGQVDKADQADFQLSDTTSDAVLHILQVSAGLESSVMGDAEIIHQIRKAYHFALERRLQGSLLERCMQTLFRTHKRVSNETGFRDGTTSTAYKALKLIGDTFGSEAAEKKILFVGAGDIVGQLFKYNNRFAYRHVFVTNRTEARAVKLARVNKVASWPWDKLINNDLNDFDVIISAVSNASGLIHRGVNAKKRVLLIDLAVPGNIHPVLGGYPNVVYHDLDTIASRLQSNRNARNAAVENVRAIIREEWSAYLQWRDMQPFRNLMASRKKQILSILGSFGISVNQNWSENEIAVLTDQLMRKVLKKPDLLQSPQNLEPLVARYAPGKAA